MGGMERETVRARLGETQVVPSILAADFARLGQQVDEVLAAGARIVHIDVMDGHFVEPLSIGAPVVAALRERADRAGAVLDVHLMVERPERQLEEMAAAGAHNVTVHLEATPQLGLALMRARDLGLTVGIALNPATPPEALAEVKGEVDLVLCMTVNPGWGGQPFLPQAPGKVARLRRFLGPALPLAVDGGIDRQTAPLCRAEGATLFVAGAALFEGGAPGERFRELSAALGGDGR